MNSSRFVAPAQVGEQFLLRPGITFLNHGSFGARPRGVLDAYHQWQRTLEDQPVEFLGRRLPTLLAEARTRLAEYVGTTADHLVFIPNATFGVNVVARSLDLVSGDEVLATNHEYGASDRAWRFICEQRGVNYINQPIPLPMHSVEEFMEQLWAGITDRTRVIFLSHITSPTALILPVAEVCRRARAAGILTVIDGAHAPSQLDLDLAALGVDFYVANCHKWLCAPPGSAFLYARPEVQDLLHPLIVSWGWRSETPSLSLFQDYFGWTGTDDPSAYLSVPTAIQFQQDHDWPAIRTACHELAQRALEGGLALTQMEPIADEAWFGQMCAIPLPSGSIERLGRRLWDKYQIEVPLVRWHDREFVRISIQAYNSQADVDRLLDALRQESANNT